MPRAGARQSTRPHGVVWKTRNQGRIGLIGLLTLAVLAGVQDWARAQEPEFAIDISHHTGEITKEDVQCWLDSGVKHIIVRAAISEEINDNRGRSRRQLMALWRAMYEDELDFSVDIYLYVHWTPNTDLNFYMPVPDQVREAISLAEEFAYPPQPLPIGRLWIDLEEVPLADQTQQDTVDLIQEALGACKDFPCGIYTRESWWKERTGDNQESPDYLLWYAQYSCPIDPTFSDFGFFGGWTDPYGKQYDEHKKLGECEANERICDDTVHDSNIMYLPPKPDLLVSDIDFTSFPVPGNPTTVMATLSNVGELSLREFIFREFTVEWFHQSPSGFESFSSSHPPVEPGMTTTAPFDWTPTRGTHTFGFLADVGHDVPEADEYNNRALVTVNVRDIDLEVSGITFLSTPAVGFQTTAVAHLANIGQDESGRFNVKWILDGDEVQTGRHDSLAAGEVSQSNTLEFHWTPTTPGEHTLQFEADADEEIYEVEEENNGDELTVTVRDVDLQVKGIRFTSTPTVGVRTTAIAHLENVGVADSVPFNVKWFLDGAQVGYGLHDSLAAGEVSDGNVKFYWSPTPGTHTLLFAADVDDDVHEVDEANNHAQVTVSTQQRWSRSLIEYRFDSESDFARRVVRNSGLVPFLFRGRIIGEARQVDAVLGKAIELDDETTYVEVEDSRWLSFGRGVTVQALVRRESNTNEDAIASKWHGGQDQWLLTFYPDGSGLLVFTVRLQNGTYATLEYPIPTTSYLGSWVQVGARFDRNDGLRLYWNGQQVGYEQTEGQGMASGRNPIHVGDAGPGAPWSRFGGQIDEVRIGPPVERDLIDLSYFYSFGDLSGTTSVLRGDTFTIWDQPWSDSTFHDIAQCQTNHLGEVRAYNHDRLSEDGPGTFGEWVGKGCSTAEEFGYVVECCVEP
ncbi:MAG TPA: CARDB domain-containing protein [Vicinamibacteria bacterium]